MNKDDWFDLIVKGFGICLLVLAIIAIPRAIQGFSMAIFFVIYNPWKESPENVADLVIAMRSNLISDGFAGAIKFILYLIASINFLRSGSLVKKLMGKAKLEQVVKNPA